MEIPTLQPYLPIAFSSADSKVGLPADFTPSDEIM